MIHLKSFDNFLNEMKSTEDSIIMNLAKEIIEKFKSLPSFKTKWDTINPSEMVPYFEETRTTDYKNPNGSNVLELFQVEASESDYDISLTFDISGGVIKNVTVQSDIAEGWEDHDEIEAGVDPEKIAKAIVKILKQVP